MKRPSNSLPQRISCSVVSAGSPSEVSSRHSMVCGMALPMSTSLMQGIGWPGPDDGPVGRRGSGSARPSRWRPRRNPRRRRTGPAPAGIARRPPTGRSAATNRPSAISMAHCSSTWSRVSSVAGSVPNSKRMPRASYQRRHASRSAAGTSAISTSSADCDSAFQRHADVAPAPAAGTRRSSCPCRSVSNRPMISLCLQHCTRRPGGRSPRPGCAAPGGRRRCGSR